MNIDKGGAAKLTVAPSENGEQLASPSLVMPEKSDTESVINYAINLIEGDVEMDFTADVPYVQVASATASKIVQAGNPKPIEYETDCREVGNAEDDADYAYNRFVVGGAVLSSLGYRFDSKKNDFEMPAQVRAGFKMYVITPPVHGEAFQSDRDKAAMFYSYRANKGYVGQDSFVIGIDTLTISGKPINFKIKFNLSVVEGITNENEKSTCVGMKFNSVPGATFAFSWDLPLPVSFSDLAAGVVGQSVGEGANAAITLDTNAAGNGWFVDSTPSDNSEFLPTSNPNEWVAKAGTAAAGKMDMLSVLLHEYGHALGIDHSANPNDFMATTLTAGVRRLPSAAEMALMQQLIAQAKTGVIAPQTGSNAATDQPNNTPLPIIPLGGFGIAFAGLLQRNRYGGMNLAVDANTIVTQYAVAANDNPKKFLSHL